ncbi:MAG: 6,7-dimethyl-8-ribityllumazine synthase [Gallionella sp.]
MKEVEKNLDGKGLRMGIVQSRFNPEICEGLLVSCRAELVRLGVADDDIMLATVPGALEIPVVLLHMADGEKYDALIALGAVVRGDTYHFEVVSNESARGVNEVQLACGVPIANAILTTDNDDQALARISVKGAEAAQAAIEMANLLRDLA